MTTNINKLKIGKYHKKINFKIINMKRISYNLMTYSIKKISFMLKISE